jgi:NAD(P)-dependent dehydrogenase (short-subunit alcohol dehydrogenase family)
MRLQEKTTIITDGARSLGEAMIKALAENGAKEK